MNTLAKLLEPEDLQSLMKQTDLVIVDLCSAQSYHTIGHIPGACWVEPADMVMGTLPAPGRFPSKEKIAHLLSRLGITPDSHVVAYDDEGGGWAGRFLWTLNAIGHSRFSYLNGGAHAWRAANMPTETTIPEVAPSVYAVQPIASELVEIADIIPAIADDNIVIWDARSPAEYTGQRVLTLKGGHIPSAINLEWTQLMDPQRELRIREDAAELLAEHKISSGNAIITYCQSHHRSAFTWLVGHLLGLSIRAYPGSWSEWGNHPETPVEC